MKFPEYRARRLRKKGSLRKLISEVKFSLSDLVMPFFVVEGKNRKELVKSMPGIFRYSVDNLIKEVKKIYKLGIKAILIFGVPEKRSAFNVQRSTERKKIKSQVLDSAYRKNGIVQRAIREIKKEIPEIVLMTDVCLCSYTQHGHCGIIRSTFNVQRSTNIEIDNDATLEVLSKVALSHAEAGADFVCPSSMMDGQVKAIREALDKNGFKDVGIMSYSAKYASNFYGPFRDAAHSSPEFGNRKSYQMDYHNLKEALREVELDIEEGADIVMVKPALAYLDVIRAVKENFNFPVAAYNVSGEYSMVKAAVEKGWIDEKEIVLEILTSIKRAGADIIITYWAEEVSKWI